MLDCVISILGSPPCTVLLWAFLSVHSRYPLDYLFTMIDVGTVCIPLYVHLPPISIRRYTHPCAGQVTLHFAFVLVLMGGTDQSR